MLMRIKNIFMILLFAFSVGRIFAADMGVITQDISDYERVDFIPPVILTSIFPKPHCSECENKVILNVQFRHEKDFKRDPISQLSYDYFPYHMVREELLDGEFRKSMPSTLASRINGIIGSSKSAIVLYDGNSAGDFGHYPTGGVYLPEKNKCLSLRKYLKRQRQKYHEYKLRSTNSSLQAQRDTRQKYLNKYSKKYHLYKKNLCDQRVLKYEPLFLNSLSGPDLVLFESSGALLEKKPNNREYAIIDTFNEIDSMVLREEPAALEGKYNPEEDINVFVGRSDHYKRLELVKSVKEFLDVDYNCQVTLHEAWKVLGPHEVTGGFQGDLKPIYDWSGQRMAIKFGSADFSSNPGAYLEQYKSTQNAVGFTTVVNLTKCRNIPVAIGSELKLVMDNSPTSRMNEGLLARVPKFFKRNELNIELATEWDYFNAKLADTPWDKLRYKMKGFRGWRDGVVQGLVGNLTGDPLDMSELARKAISDPEKAKELMKKIGKAGVDNIKEFYLDDDGSLRSLGEINKKLTAGGKEMVIEGGKLVVKNCKEDRCRGVSKLAFEVGLGVVTGGLAVKATAKVVGKVTKAGAKITTNVVAKTVAKLTSKATGESVGTVTKKFVNKMVKHRKVVKKIAGDIVDDLPKMKLVKGAKKMPDIDPKVMSQYIESVHDLEKVFPRNSNFGEFYRGNPSEIPLTRIFGEFDGVAFKDMTKRQQNIFKAVVKRLNSIEKKRGRKFLKGQGLSNAEIMHYERTEGIADLLSATYGQRTDMGKVIKASKFMNENRHRIPWLREMGDDFDYYYRIVIDYERIH